MNIRKIQEEKACLFQLLECAEEDGQQDITLLWRSLDVEEIEFERDKSLTRDIVL
jgi:hypothetical protein